MAREEADLMPLNFRFLVCEMGSETQLPPRVGATTE